MDQEKLKEAIKKGENELKDKLPQQEELVTLSKQELDDLIESVRREASEKIAEAVSQVDKLRVKYEQQEAESYLNRRGSPTNSKIVVHPNRDFGPPDGMDLIAKEHSAKLKNKAARFVTGRPEIRSLRRSQGYEPIKDEDGAEVRYMDSVLMAMPERKYQEEIAKPIAERKAVNRRAVVERFKGSAENAGVKVDGDGIKYDVGE